MEGIKKTEEPKKDEDIKKLDFSQLLMSPEVAGELPPGYHMRPLRRSDYSAGFLDCLSVLTTVGDISQERFDERYDWVMSQAGTYYIIVIVDTNVTPHRIVGTGALVFERKFIRNLGSVGHIEDIAVAKDQQGKKLGLRLIQALDHLAQQLGCYKTILDCSETNEGFYNKCGFRRAGLEMSHYHNENKSNTQ